MRARFGMALAGLLVLILLVQGAAGLALLDASEDSPTSAAPTLSQGVAWPAPAWRAVSEHEPPWACPQGSEDTLGQFGDPNVIVARAQCPFRISDASDLLGSPAIAVNEDRPHEVAFFSLHGVATDQGPTSRSRAPNGPGGTSGLTHTTFTSSNQGWDWTDNPWGDRGFGEQVHGIMDRDGNMYIAQLLSFPIGEEGGIELYDYRFQLYKENTVKDRPAYSSFEIENRATGNVIEEVNLALVTPASRIETQAQYQEYLNRTRDEQKENETQGPSDDGDIGNHTIPQDEEDRSDDLVVAVWHEKAYDWRNATTGKSSWIDAVWTNVTSRHSWRHLDDDQLIGPCRDASNPASWNGRIYVACVTDAGYNSRRGAQIGDVDIWAIDPQDGTKHLMGQVPGLKDGRPRLAMNSDGLMVVTSTKALGTEPHERVQVQMIYGWYGRTWISGATDVGNAIRNAWDGEPVLEARVTSLVMLDEPPTAYLVYHERVNTTLQQPSIDPNGTPTTATVEYHKALAGFEYCVPGMPLALWDMQVGLARHPFEEGVVNDFTGVFDDLQDGMVVTHDKALGTDMVHFAIGDHGTIQYGAFYGDGGDSVCPSPIAPVLFTAPPALPAPQLLSTGVNLALAASLGAPAALGLGYLLVAKRRVALASATKSK